MLKKTIKFTDYNGVEREEEHYFNLTKAEITEMELSIEGGLAEYIRRIISAQSSPEIVKLFKQLIFKAYGQKSADGRRFVKSDELSLEFSQTEAYSILFMELASDADAAAEFVNGIIPEDAKKDVANLKPVSVEK